MSNTNYESPNIEFHEMNILERIAAKCWGYGQVTYGKTVYSIGKGCDSSETIYNQFAGLIEGLTVADCNPNTKSGKFSSSDIIGS